MEATEAGTEMPMDINKEELQLVEEAMKTTTILRGKTEEQPEEEEGELLQQAAYDAFKMLKSPRWGDHPSERDGGTHVHLVD